MRPHAPRPAAVSRALDRAVVQRDVQRASPGVERGRLATDIANLTPREAAVGLLGTSYQVGSALGLAVLLKTRGSVATEAEAEDSDVTREAIAA